MDEIKKDLKSQHATAELKPAPAIKEDEKLEAAEIGSVDTGPSEEHFADSAPEKEEKWEFSVERKTSIQTAETRAAYPSNREQSANQEKTRGIAQPKPTFDEKVAKPEPMTGFIWSLQEKNMAMQIAPNVWAVTGAVLDNLNDLRKDYERERAANPLMIDEKNRITARSWNYRQVSENAGNHLSADKLEEAKALNRLRYEYGGDGTAFKKETFRTESSDTTVSMTMIYMPLIIKIEPELIQRYVRVQSLVAQSGRALALRIQISERHYQKMAVKREAARLTIRTKLLAKKRKRSRSS